MAVTRSVKTRVYVNIEAVETIDPGDGGAPTVKVHPFVYDETFLGGNGAGQFNRVYSDVASATVSNDVDTVTDAGGTALAITNLGIVAVKCKGTSSTDVARVGGNAAAVPHFGAVGDYAIIGGKGLYLQVDPLKGWTVTGSTGDIVDVTHTTGTWDHEALFVGRV